jgi:transcription elongation factor GreB
MQVCSAVHNWVIVATSRRIGEVWHMAAARDGKSSDKKNDKKDDKKGEKNYITRAGYQRLVDELTWLATVERPRIVREVSDAAAEGDRSENASYIYGKRRLREIDRRMGFLSRRLKFVEVVSIAGRDATRVFFGATVAVEDGDGETTTYRIVGVDEVQAEKGQISWQSPIGRSLLGKRLDDTVVVRWHAGKRELTIVDIRYEES